MWGGSKTSCVAVPTKNIMQLKINHFEQICGFKFRQISSNYLVTLFRADTAGLDCKGFFPESEERKRNSKRGVRWLLPGDFDKPETGVRLGIMLKHFDFRYLNMLCTEQIHTFWTTLLESFKIIWAIFVILGQFYLEQNSVSN